MPQVRLKACSESSCSRCTLCHRMASHRGGFLACLPECRYPAITLLLVVLTNSEMAIRRFMYYRMMSLRVSKHHCGLLPACPHHAA